MQFSEKDFERLAASLNREFEADIPQSTNIWVHAEMLARAYRAMGKADISQRYFRMAAQTKERRLMAFRIQDGKVAHIMHRAHTALLYRYTGEADKAQYLFGQVVVEANAAFYEPLDDEDRRILLETLLYVDLVNSDYDKANHHLNILKDISAKHPGAFRPVPKAIEVALRAQAASDAGLASQAVEAVQEIIAKRKIAPETVTGYISEWDVLDLLIAMGNASQAVCLRKEPAMLVDVKADEATRSARLTRLLEYDLPTFGLDWPLAERIARLYQSLGNHQAAKSYFSLAARLIDAQITEMASLYHRYHKDLAIVECKGYAAWLHHWAGKEEKKCLIVDDTIAQAEAGLERYKVSISIRFCLLETLVHMNILKGDIKAAWQHASAMKEILATVKDRVQPTPSTTLETINIIVGAKALHDQNLVRRATAHLETCIDAADLPIDITGCIAGRDLLGILRLLG